VLVYLRRCAWSWRSDASTRRRLTNTRPSFFYHGYHGDVNNFYYLQEWLQEAHPGQYMNSINLFNGDTNSTKPMYEQVAGVIAYIENATQADGLSQYHLVCHSQGGLVCRAVLEMFNGHNVSNFVSMAGVGNGFFGGADTFFGHVETDLAWLYMYTKAAQKSYSVANYWRDPREVAYKAYLKDNVFLPIINNQTYNPNADEYKANFLRTKHAYFYGGPQDGTIQPWQSSLLGYYEDGSDKTILPMNETYIYTHDTFGLQTMDKEGRLTVEAVPNCTHVDWLTSKDIFTNYVLPHLD